MFKIKGSDGNEYGPVSADVICQWIGERRAGAQTRIQAEGSTEWKTLSELPEFAAALAAQPSSAPSAGPPLLARAAQPRPSQTSGLAIASLVLGILGICSGGLTAIPGLVLGLVALSKINRSE